MKRIGIPKKLRFEVFKRDSFTCQYCGQKAPDVVLHCDHIIAVADGGKSEILNLVTACAGCNLGKGRTALDDRTVVERQHSQLAELQERREQLEMMLEWRNSLESIAQDEIAIIETAIEQRSSVGINDYGRSEIRKWLKRYSVTELLSATDKAFDQYAEFRRGQMTSGSWQRCFDKIPAIASVTRQTEAKPYLLKVLYIQGILRRRFKDKWGKYVSALEEMVEDGAGIEPMEQLAKKAETWDDYCEAVNGHIAEVRALSKF